MKKLTFAALAASAFLSACAVVPVPVVYDTPRRRNARRDRQEKGNCGPAYDAPERNFCPPGTGQERQLLNTGPGPDPKREQ